MSRLEKIQSFLPLITIAIILKIDWTTVGNALQQASETYPELTNIILMIIFFLFH
jgi:hypothetical protein